MKAAALPCATFIYHSATQSPITCLNHKIRGYDPNGWGSYPVRCGKGTQNASRVCAGSLGGTPHQDHLDVERVLGARSA